jgi:NMD protein affecting ribosome stability and mRNA decay
MMQCDKCGTSLNVDELCVAWFIANISADHPAACEVHLCRICSGHVVEFASTSLAPKTTESESRDVAAKA